MGKAATNRLIDKKPSGYQNEIMAGQCRSIHPAKFGPIRIFPVSGIHKMSDFDHNGYTRRLDVHGDFKGSRRNKFAFLGVEAPVWQGAKVQEYPDIPALWQRSQAGCIGA